MARQTIVKVVDDLDGAELPENVRARHTFSLDGKTWEIDLSQENWSEFANAMEPYVQAGRSTPGRRPGKSTGSGGGGNPNREYNRRVRAWARDNDVPVSERGRISREVIEKFEQAHQQ